MYPARKIKLMIFRFFRKNGYCIGNWPCMSIDQFRVPKTLTFKMRSSAQPFFWKWGFKINGWALNLVLVQTPGGTRKWPINIPFLIFFSTVASWRPYVKIDSLEVCFSHATFIWPCLDAYVSKKYEKFFISSRVVRVSIDSGAAQYQLISKQE